MIVTSKRVCESALVTGDNQRLKVRDLLFDDRTWQVRYFVIGTGRLLNYREVLLLPDQISDAVWSQDTLHTQLPLAELRQAPGLLSNPPVAKQGELEAARIIAWEAYWTGIFDRQSAVGDPHLRNVRAVTGHQVRGLDSEVGTVHNFVIDEQEWTIRYLVVRLGKGRHNRKVLIDPHLVDEISWQQHSVWIRLAKEAVEKCETFAANR